MPYANPCDYITDDDSDHESSKISLINTEIQTVESFLREFEKDEV